MGREIKLGILFIGDGAPIPDKINSVLDFVSSDVNLSKILFHLVEAHPGHLMEHYLITGSNIDELDMSHDEITQRVVWASDLIVDASQYAEGIVNIGDGTIDKVDVGEYNSLGTYKFTLRGHPNIWINVRWEH